MLFVNKNWGLVLVPKGLPWKHKLPLMYSVSYVPPSLWLSMSESFTLQKSKQNLKDN